MRQMTYSLVRIGSHEKIKQRLSHNGKPSITLKLTFAVGFTGALGGILGNSSGAFVCGSIKYRLDAKPFLSDLVREPGEQYNYPDAAKAFSGVKIFED